MKRDDAAREGVSVAWDWKCSLQPHLLSSGEPTEQRVLMKTYSGTRLVMSDQRTTQACAHSYEISIRDVRTSISSYTLNRSSDPVFPNQDIHIVRKNDM